MNFRKTSILGSLVIGAFLFQYCSKSDVTNTSAVTAAASFFQLPATPYNYSNLPLPGHIASYLTLADNTPASNPITNYGATLGRVLFYDKNLSKNNTTSCGSCHRPNMAFSDSAIKSKGFQGELTDRHSMQLLNVRFYRSGKMFWDERANTLEEQVLQPIQNSKEMGLTLAELLTRVAAQNYYPSLFQNAFGSTEITTDKISKALSQFVRSIVTYQSKYDLVKQGQASFTTDEQDGETLFLTAGNNPCGGCHAPPMFLTSNPARPFGLADPNDLGINGSGRFKSGSLRNIAISGPYFHNGSVPTLQAMLGGNIPAHGVAAQDRARLIAFLQTLTDVTSTSDVKYSDPFIR